MRAFQTAPCYKRGHNLSHRHNWALPWRVIINPCVSHGASSIKGNTTAASFTPLKRCNDRRAQLCWGVFTPAARSLNRRSTFQSGLSSQLPGEGSPSPAVVLRDALRVCACVRVCISLSLFMPEPPCNREKVGHFLIFCFIPLQEWFTPAVRTISASMTVLEWKDLSCFFE